MLISDGLFFKKKPLVATSSEACAHTPRKCFAEESKNVRKRSEKQIILVALLCSCLYNFSVRNNFFFLLF